MNPDRAIRWEGFYNARDLGGLPTSSGRPTRRGALIRSADLRFVTEAGWRDAYDAGVRTIVDLRNDDEVGAGGPAVPAGMARIQVPIDDAEDTEFWRYLNDNGLNGTPLYFQPFLDRKPDRCAAAVTAIARAQPGGVIVHCGAGRDRTGLVTLLLLSLVGVAPEVIAADYDLSTAGVAPLYALVGRKDEAPIIARLLAAKETTAAAVIHATCDGFDAEAYLLAAGTGPDDIERIRARLLA